MLVLTLEVCLVIAGLYVPFVIWLTQDDELPDPVGELWPDVVLDSEWTHAIDPIDGGVW